MLAKVLLSRERESRKIFKVAHLSRVDADCIASAAVIGYVVIRVVQ